ncbi:MAG: secondary thiamine-phosphate synthase enzyme YjbQ [Termitinemataceae bacterium]
MEFTIHTEKAEQFIDITSLIQKAVTESGLDAGCVVVFVPHTTAGLTINENADPDVIHDLLMGLDRVFPHNLPYRHGEGNSHAHLKASTVGSSVTVLVEAGRLRLGTWQGIYLCEFDGPRRRQVWVSVIGKD